MPIPPELVTTLRSHLDRFGTGPDGRLFRGSRRAMLSETTYGRQWQKARQKALTPAQARSPLAERHYDLRHSGVTLQLNAGVPAPEIARRAGHGVAVLLRVYAGCVDGQEQIWNSSLLRWWQVLGSNQRRLSRRFYSGQTPDPSPSSELRKQPRAASSGARPTTTQPPASATTR
ncbi:MAG: hypothetical protein ACRDRJ_26725 [Streptosporangiaceae bacterium]